MIVSESDSTKLNGVMAEIQGLLEVNDMTGIILLSTEDAFKCGIKMDASWSLLKQTSEIRLEINAQERDPAKIMKSARMYIRMYKALEGHMAAMGNTYKAFLELMQRV